MKASFSIGRALSDGLGLIVRRPLAVLLWGVLLTLPTVVAMWGLWPILLGQFTDPQGAGVTDWEEIIRYSGWSALHDAVNLAVQGLVGAAIIRATLDWRAGALGAVRVGPAELFYLTVQGVILILFVAAAFLTILLGVSVAMAVRSLADPVGPIIIGVFALLLLAGLLWGWARTGLISVVSVGTRTLAFEAGWRLSRGREIKLALMGLAALALATVVSLATLAPVGLALWWLGVPMDPGEWSRMTPFSLDDLLRARGIAGGMALGLASLWAIFGFGATVAMAYAPWASAARQLQAAHPAQNPTHAA